MHDEPLAKERGDTGLGTGQIHIRLFDPFLVNWGTDLANFARLAKISPSV